MYISKKQVEMRDVVGYENLYGVTNDGRVWSYKNKCWLQQFENNSGYMRVALCKDGKDKRELVHRLVAKAFVENTNPDKFDIADHIDRDKKNNNADNLRWTDNKTNSQNADKVKPLVDFEELWEYHSLSEASKATGLPVTQITRECALADLGINDTRFKFSDSLVNRDIHRLMREYFKDIIPPDNKKVIYKNVYYLNTDPSLGFCDRFFSEHILHPTPARDRKKKADTGKTEYQMYLTADEWSSLINIISNADSGILSKCDKKLCSDLLKANKE